MDFFFVQGIPFYHVISRGTIGFSSVQKVPDRGKAVIVKATRAVIEMYQSRGFKVCDIHADSEFECIREEVRPVEMNIVPTDSHVGEIERSVRTIKERLRTCVHGLPFEHLPKLMIRHMVDDAVRCLNQFPWKNGISEDMSPAAIVRGHPPPDFNKMRLELGTYVQVFEDNDPTNTTRARSMGAIALGLTGNSQGDYNFMSPSTGAKISRHQWTELPMTDTAIARVHALGIEDGQPLLQERGLVVEWRHDQHIGKSEPLNDAAAHGLFIEPEDKLVALAQGADEDVNPRQDPDDDPWWFDNNAAQPAIEDHNDDADNDADNDADDADDASDTTVDHPHEDEDVSDHLSEAEDNERADEDDSNGGAHEDDNEGAYGNEGAHDDEGAYAHDEQAGVPEDEPVEHIDPNDENETNAGDEAEPYNLRHRGPAETARFNEAMDNPHDGKS